MMNRRTEVLGLFLALVLSAVVISSCAPVFAQELPEPPTNPPPYIHLTADPAEIEADGSTTSTITARVWDGDSWISGGAFAVSFSTDLGEITELVPLMNETAPAILTAGTTAGTATVTAEMNLSGDFMTNTTTVVFIAPGGNGGSDGSGNGGSGGSGGSSGGTTTPTPTASPTTTPGESPIPSATPIDTISPSATPSGTPGAMGTPMPAPTATATPTAVPTAEPTPEEPGFGALFAITGILAVVYLLVGRRAR